MIGLVQVKVAWYQAHLPLQIPAVFSCDYQENKAGPVFLTKTLLRRVKTCREVVYNLHTAREVRRNICSLGNSAAVWALKTPICLTEQVQMKLVQELKN